MVPTRTTVQVRQSPTSVIAEDVFVGGLCPLRCDP